MGVKAIARGCRSDEYLLSRAVEFANTPEVAGYREAFHRWRSNMIIGGKSPELVAADLREQIGVYGEWVQRNKRNTAVQVACAVGAVATGVAAASGPSSGCLPMQRMLAPRELSSQVRACSVHRSFGDN